MRYLSTITAALVLSTSAAVAVDPDEVRDRAARETAAQVETRQKADADPGHAHAAAALSAAFKKYGTSRMLTWRASSGGSVLFMGQFNSAEHCAEARRVLQRQLVRYGWGRAECLEIVLP